MTLVLSVSCDGAWDEGRFPCRAKLSNHRDAPLAEALREEAIRGGWSLTPDGDLCPTHARTKETP